MPTYARESVVLERLPRQVMFWLRVLVRFR